ncbi:MAG TPA: hypothetical protein VFJ58_05010 [Armatimonadota bacterium]|nr:hypothetical protein [Armatimonadota bacterium]
MRLVLRMPPVHQTAAPDILTTPDHRSPDFQSQFPITMLDLEISHFHPGRLRVRLARVAKDPLFAEQLRQTIASIGGITAVSTSGITGSVLICYDPTGLDLKTLLGFGKMLGVVPPEFMISGAASAEPISPQAFSLAMAPEAIVTRLNQAFDTVFENGGRLAEQALNPRVAVSAVGLNAAARALGIKMGLAVSPSFAAAWIAASILLGPLKKSRP